MSASRRDFLKTAGTATLALPAAALAAGRVSASASAPIAASTGVAEYGAAQSPHAAGAAPSILTRRPTLSDDVIGHGDFRYRVESNWSDLDPASTPVKNCHEMVMDRRGRLIMITDEVRNNVITFDKSGRLLETWGTAYPGGHGLSIWDAGGDEFLFIADYERGVVDKTTLEGRVEMTLPDPRAIGEYPADAPYKPTETAVGPNGDIYVADGYGSQFVLQFTGGGEFIRKFGGKGDADEQFSTVHGLAVDYRAVRSNGGDPGNEGGAGRTIDGDPGNDGGAGRTVGGNSGNDGGAGRTIDGGAGNVSGANAIDHNAVLPQPTLLCTSRGHNSFKRFSLDGEYLETIFLPGAFVCRPVIAGDQLYAGVCWSRLRYLNQTPDSGFVTILDADGRVLSNPGGTAPSYDSDSRLELMVQADPVFKHCHDVCVDDENNLYVCQWNAGGTYPVKLHRV